MQTFESGWVGISLALRLEEIDALIEHLALLKRGVINHFHIVQNAWGKSPGVADIELSVLGEAGSEDMQVG